MSGDIIAFATARLDEEEAAARAASPGPWAIAKAKTAEAGELAILSGGATVIGSGYEGGGIWDLPDAEHIARNDPARTLRDIEGKRRIVADYRTACSFVGGTEHAAIREVLDRAVRCLLLRWADHPDYDQGWKPS